MSESDIPLRYESSPRPSSRLWLWFLTGFIIAFIGMSVLLSMNFFDGRVVYRTKLWHYYILEMERTSNSSGYLGPSSGSSAIGTVVFQHILLSIGGGAVLMSIAWIVR